MLNSSRVTAAEEEFRALLSELTALQRKILDKLTPYADGKTLKGNEIVGWLGEVYGKLLLDGNLVHDREEHDVICANGWRVSVKTRKGSKGGWRRTSAIPKVDGATCPTHLMFVHLKDDYSIDRMWLFDWPDLVQSSRFTEHIVRGSRRSFVFLIDEEKDKANVVYARAGESGELPSPILETSREKTSSWGMTRPASKSSSA